MSKKTTGTDIGYRAYFAAFAVMIIIVLAAICILSGCLDSIIFRAEAPAWDDTDEGKDTEKENKDTDKALDKADAKDPAVDISPDTDENTPTPEDSESESDTAAESESTSESESKSEKETEDTDTSSDTEKEDETTEEDETTATPPKEETTAPDETEEPEIDESEIITEPDDNIGIEFSKNDIIVKSYDGNPTKIAVPQTIDTGEVTIIGGSAFAGIDTLEEVRISAGIIKIESQAMANCPNLVYVYIPSTVKSIASDAFDGSSNVVIHCAKGSFAETFAKNNSFNYTTY